MRTYDLAPLYRASVGFDQIADLMDRAFSEPTQKSYPPYNIEKTADDTWRISVAVAGFSDEELGVEVKENSLLITGKKSDEATSSKFLHRGIANRAFQRRFHLADHVRVTSASTENGMLFIDLVREIPEALKPRQIEITKAAVLDKDVVDAKAVN